MLLSSVDEWKLLVYADEQIDKQTKYNIQMKNWEYFTCQGLYVTK